MKDNEKTFLLCIKVLDILSKTLPAPVWLWFCRNSVAFLGRFRQRELDVCIAQLKFANASCTERDRFLDNTNYRDFSLRVFRHLGECIGELFIIDRLFKEVPSPSMAPKPPLGESLTPFEHFSSEGWEHFRDLINSHKGAVVLSGHLGCIELLAAYYARCGVPLTVAGRQPNFSGFAGWLERLREAYGVETMWREDKASSRKLRYALKEGRFIASLIDQDTKLESNFAPFFGLEAAHPISPIRMAIKFKLPVYSSFIVRDAPMHHHMTTEPIPYEYDDPEAERKILETFSARLEKMVRRYPEQWIWWHKRWRRRPEIDYEKNPEKLPGSGAYVAWVDTQRESLYSTDQNSSVASKIA